MVDPPSEAVRHVEPLELGGARVFIEHFGPAGIIEADDSIYAVAPPTPSEAAEQGLDFVRAAVRAMGERIAEFADASRPDELTLEFTVTFDARGKASVIPFLVTGEIGGGGGFRVSAVWRNLGRPATDR